MQDDIERLSPLQRAVFALKKTRMKLDTLEQAQSEPIAIVGMGCRFPGGAHSPEAFWELLHAGRDTVTEVPRERWDVDAYYDPEPATPGKMYSRCGAFLSQVDQFDPQFFGILPREAVSMDPQQRLLLEVSWEALEDAGCAPSGLANSPTGVFVGVTGNEYGELILSHGVAETDSYYISGNPVNTVAGRLSYVLGLQGPTLALDTACSSSLVTVHLACQSLRVGECDLALAGGVNLTLGPVRTVLACQARMLSPDGRCKTFDAAADGYVRGEGCGMVVLKRLSQAQADGDRILAMIRGSAVNHDGPSSGFTVPNGPAQQALIRRALEAAKVTPSEVDYIEAHGTGTSLGDPIELGSLGAVHGGREEPLVVGSVKTNMGHLEAAAGIAGLIKVALSLKNEEIAPHLHFNEPNPHIPWAELPIQVPTQPIPWPRGERRRLAGVSSFGVSGTNAHVVLEEAPAVEVEAVVSERPMHVLALSAKSEGALQELAGRYARHVAGHPELGIGDVCFTANTGRSHFAQRLAVVADTGEELAQRLGSAARGESVTGVVRGESSSGEGKLAFLFTGQGSQYVGMGRELYESEAVFREALERCAEILEPQLERPLLSVLYAQDEGSEGSLLDETGYTQPALFALEYALSELWRSWGIEPSVVLGHSVGEYVAACVAGVFSLEDGLKLIAERGRLMQALPRDGAMAAVFAEEARVLEALSGREDVLSVGAVNGPGNVVVSGQAQALEEVLAGLKSAGVRSKRLTVSHAFHSPLMEPMLDAFEAVAAEVTYAPPRLGLVSNVTGGLVDGEAVCNAGYWRSHVRSPVRFADSLLALSAQGCKRFLEVGPGTTLLGMGQQCVEVPGGLWLPTLRKGRSDWAQVLETLSELYVNGVTVDWAGVDRAYPRRRVSLPTYPFQRQRYWVEASAASPGVARAFAETSVVRLLEEGNAKELAQELRAMDGFSDAEAGLMPKVLEALVRRHRDEAASAEVQDWLYEVQWRVQPRRLPAPVVEESGRGVWVLLADRGGVAQALAGVLEAQGGECLLVYPSPPDEVRSEDARHIDPANPDDYARVMEAAAGESGRPVEGVVHLWGLDAPAGEEITVASLEEAQRVGSVGMLHLVQALRQLEEGSRARLSVVTRGVVPAREAPGAAALCQAPLWGLGKTVALECPELWGGMVDLSPEAVEDEAAQLWAELTDAEGEDQVALRDGQRYVARLVRGGPKASPEGVQLAAEATYLVTGGLGGLGLLPRSVMPRYVRWRRSVDYHVHPRSSWELQRVLTGSTAGRLRLRVPHLSHADYGHHSRRRQRLFETYRRAGRLAWLRPLLLAVGPFLDIVSVEP